MTTTFTIDCQTCPARGRMCGDCFVPVLGRTWLQPPTLRDDGRGEGPERHPHAELHPHAEHEAQAEPAPGLPDLPTAPLDTDELAAVSAFVRAGLVDPAEAAGVRARVTTRVRSAAG
ncbi:hypothetical protein [Ornithinimicrobium flavum]|uniref:hypothetical protein n=1 Tax=Ornithinimicrobium flavum TaxID=1288636 RepID=UPI00106F54F4|nr:hypothetical protein [Ornithinimicrobium flavum]